MRMLMLGNQACMVNDIYKIEIDSRTRLNVLDLNGNVLISVSGRNKCMESLMEDVVSFLSGDYNNFMVSREKIDKMGFDI